MKKKNNNILISRKKYFIKEGKKLYKKTKSDTKRYKNKQRRDISLFRINSINKFISMIFRRGYKQKIFNMVFKFLLLLIKLNLFKNSWSILINNFKKIDIKLYYSFKKIGHNKLVIPRIQKKDKQTLQGLRLFINIIRLNKRKHIQFKILEELLLLNENKSEALMQKKLLYNILKKNKMLIKRYSQFKIEK